MQWQSGIYEFYEECPVSEISLWALDATAVVEDNFTEDLEFVL
jgi:hypothetical protein